MNILITRLQNIGDMLAFLPALRMLRHSLPQANITLLTKHAGGVEIVRNCPYYDNLIVVKNRSLKEKLRLIREFRRLKLDYFIISPQDLGRVPWALMGGAKNIIGYKRVWNKGEWKREKLPFMLTMAPPYKTDRTETESCAALVETLLLHLGVAPVKPAGLQLEYSWFQPASIEKVNRLLTKYELTTQHFVALAPYSKQSNKNWAPYNWQQICCMLIEYGCRVLLLGGKAEAESCRQLSRDCGDEVISLAGELSLDEAAFLIKNAVLFIGPDSGPAFLATAVATPAVVLYGPADYRRWRPAELSVPRIDIHAADKVMSSISVSEVADAIKQLLAVPVGQQ